MNKIIEKVIEPSKIEVNSTFKLKIKAIRYVSYSEISKMSVYEIKQCTVSELKGE